TTPYFSRILAKCSDDRMKRLTWSSSLRSSGRLRDAHVRESRGRGVIMADAPVPNAVQCDRTGRSGSPNQAADQFFAWSLGKIRRAAFVLLAAAAPAVIGFWTPLPFIKWLCLVWLAGVALLMYGLSRRACAEMVVLSVDQTGILDHRLMSEHIAW